jgi:hypothetical protein
MERDTRFELATSDDVGIDHGGWAVPQRVRLSITVVRWFIRSGQHHETIAIHHAIGLQHDHSPRQRVRRLAPLASSSETDLLSERLGQLVNGLDTLGSELATSVDGKSAHARCGELLARARAAMEGCRLRLLGVNPTMPAPAPVTAPPKPRQAVETAADSRATHTPIDSPHRRPRSSRARFLIAWMRAVARRRHGKPRSPD